MVSTDEGVKDVDKEENSGGDDDIGKYALWFLYSRLLCISKINVIIYALGMNTVTLMMKINSGYYLWYTLYIKCMSPIVSCKMCTQNVPYCLMKNYTQSRIWCFDLHVVFPLITC